MKCKLRYIAFMLLIFSAISKLNAQENDKHTFVLSDLEMGMELDFNMASTLNNALLNASGFITDDLKNENLERLGSVNEGGSYLDLKIFYKQNRESLWGVKRLGYYFALEYHLIDEYQFSRDLYYLVLYGNKNFIGRKADIGNSGREQINYYQFKSGLHWQSANERHSFGLNLGLNLGNRLLSMQLYSPSSLYTDTLGTELVLDADVRYIETDTSRTQWHNISGMGGALDFYYKYEEKDHFSLIFSMENLGFIHWNRNTIDFAEAKRHSFQGVEVANIFDIPDPFITSNDTLMDYVYSNANQKAGSLLTPVDFKIRFKQFFMNKKVEMNALVHYRMFSYMRPLFQLDAVYAIHENIKIGPILSSGGYTRFNAGLKMEFEFGNYIINLESRYLTGFAQHSFSGMGGFINFTYKI